MVHRLVQAFLSLSFLFPALANEQQWNNYGTNWQQDMGSMDHDVSSVEFRVGQMAVNQTNIEVEQDIIKQHRLKSNITQQYCEKLYHKEIVEIARQYPDGGYCNLTFDLLLCWPPAPLNGTSIVRCFSEFNGMLYDDTQNTTRHCFSNGTWSRANYEEACLEIDVFSGPAANIINTQVNIYLAGYIISAFTLSIALFIFTYFKELRCLRNVIHMNLMWSYVLNYTMWIISLVEVKLGHELGVSCIFLITLLHYFHITTFFWMFVEGLYLYILVCRTLTRESFKLRVYAVIGWGIPMFFILLWVTVKAFLHVPKADASMLDGCIWITSHPIDYIYQVPTLIVTFANVIFLISIMVVLVTKLRSANTQEIQQYRKAMKALAVLIPLLGVTYAITIYAPNLSTLDLIRAGLLSLQGFMVALFYCFLNMEVQNTLKHHFANWKTQKSLGPNRLGSSRKSKDWSPRSRTESISAHHHTDWTLLAPEDIEDLANGRRVSRASVHSHHNNSTGGQHYHGNHHNNNHPENHITETPAGIPLLGM